MALKNTFRNYGSVARFLHWVMAFAILAMFGWGKWMVSLGFYSPWYKDAPYLHKSAGILLLILLTLRFFWRLANLQPDDSYLAGYEKLLSRLTHWAFYVLLLAQMVAGYLISSVDGRSIEVFGLFSVPSVYQNKGLEDTMGDVHEILAYVILALAAVHVLAALKHHFIDRDITLKRMLRNLP